MLRLQFIGHIGKDAVINQIEGGRTVINFNVANTQKYKNRDGNLVEKTMWISCSYWTDRTAIAPYLKKGQQVYVEGEPAVDWYNSNNSRADGIVAQQKCNVQRVELLGKANTGQQQGQQGVQQSTGSQSSQAKVVYDANDIITPIDDLPF